MKKLFLIYFLSLCLLFYLKPNHAYGSFSDERELLSTDLKIMPNKPRSYFWMPFFSNVLPGFDQWLEHQWDAGLVYSGIYLTGASLANDASSRINFKLYDKDKVLRLSNRNDDIRQYIFGNQLILFSGGMSAYHSFRSAVKSHHSNGRFLYLKEQDEPLEVLKAPFKFGNFIHRPTTWTPLLLAGILAGSGIFSEGTSQINFTYSDALYTSGFSYNAGVHEEALYRGWLLPVFYENMHQNAFWSNATQSLLFAAAHIGPENKIPLAQLLLGYYWGYLTMKNNWSIAESVFIHTWWDVIIFAGVYMHESRTNPSKAMMRLPVLQWSF